MATRPSNGTEALAELLTDALAQAAPVTPLDPQLREDMRQRLQARIAQAAPPRTKTLRAEQFAWRQWWPGVWAKVLERDAIHDLQITLFRMDPGSIVPGHEHEKSEECVVLEGELFIGSHRVAASDVHIADAGSRHPDISTRTGARLLVRSEILRQV